MSESFDTSGTLDIFDLSRGPECAEHRATVATEEKFFKLIWSPATGNNPLGLIAGGMESGVINLWNPTLTLEGDDEKQGLVHSAKLHSGSVKGLDFNPLQADRLASGGANGEVLVWDLNSMKGYQPGTDKGPSGESDITSVAWSRENRAIFATSADNGCLVLWDLKQRRAAVNFKAGHSRCSQALWTPNSNCFNLIACIDDDSNPVIHLWDLRKYLAPTYTFRGHTGGVLSASWCPKDSSYLLSSGRDGRTLCWNFPRKELQGEVDAFPGWAFDVQWSPTLPCIASSSSIDGQISLYSLTDLPASNFEHPPHWLKRPVGAAFGFGGKLAKFFQGEGKKNTVELMTLPSDAGFVQRAETLVEAIKKSEFVKYCETQIKEQANQPQHTTWEYLKILFDENPRIALLKYLGLDGDKMSAEISAFIKAQDKEENGKEPVQEVVAPVHAVPVEKEKSPVPLGDPFFADDNGDDSDFDLLSIASAALPDGVTIPREPAHAGVAESLEQLASSPSANGHSQRPVVDLDFNSTDPIEAMITKCLLCLNFQAAVDCLFNADRVSDALILACIGGPELLKKTQQRYLSKHTSSAMSLISLIWIRKDYEGLVRYASIEHWREILAALCSWTESEFSPLCELLGDRLLNEAQDPASALLVYICAANIDKAVSIWLREDNGNDAALSDLVEKAIVFSRAIGQSKLPQAIEASLVRFCDTLACEGKVDLALYYLMNLDASPGSPAFLLRSRISDGAKAAVAKQSVGVPKQPPTPAPQNNRALLAGNKTHTRPPPVPVPEPNRLTYPPVVTTPVPSALTHNQYPTHVNQHLPAERNNAPLHVAPPTLQQRGVVAPVQPVNTLNTLNNLPAPTRKISGNTQPLPGFQNVNTSVPYTPPLSAQQLMQQSHLSHQQTPPNGVSTTLPEPALPIMPPTHQQYLANQTMMASPPNSPSHLIKPQPNVQPNLQQAPQPQVTQRKVNTLPSPARTTAKPTSYKPPSSLPTHPLAQAEPEPAHPANHQQPIHPPPLANANAVHPPPMPHPPRVTPHPPTPTVQHHLARDHNQIVPQTQPLNDSGLALPPPSRSGLPQPNLVSSTPPKAARTYPPKETGPAPKELDPSLPPPVSTKAKAPVQTEAMVDSTHVLTQLIHLEAVLRERNPGMADVKKRLETIRDKPLSQSLATLLLAFAEGLQSGNTTQSEQAYVKLSTSYFEVLGSSFMIGLKLLKK